MYHKLHVAAGYPMTITAELFYAEKNGTSYRSATTQWSNVAEYALDQKGNLLVRHVGDDTMIRGYKVEGLHVFIGKITEEDGTIRYQHN